MILLNAHKFYYILFLFAIFVLKSCKNSIKKTRQTVFALSFRINRIKKMSKSLFANDYSRQNLRRFLFDFIDLPQKLLPQIPTNGFIDFVAN